MDKSLIEKYKAEMMGMYRSSKPILPESEVIATANFNEKVDEIPKTDESTGGLIVVVTTIRSLYPLKNAKVTVFSGEIDNKNIIDTSLTDQSGRTKTFTLATPQKSISLNSESRELPYELYGIEINAEGYIDTIYTNVPVFSGTTSIQMANMMLLETAGKEKGPIIYDTAEQYDLNEEG